MNNSDSDLLETIKLVVEAIEKIEEKEYVEYYKNYKSILKESELFFNDDTLYHTNLSNTSHKEARLSLKFERLYMIYSRNYNREIFSIPDLDKVMLRKFKDIKIIRDTEESQLSELLNIFN